MLGIRHYENVAIDLFMGDITKFVCDAVVNAANSELSGGGGVDGAIHTAGGPSIMNECRSIGGCPTGTAVSTSAGELPASFVIHTVGPIWEGGGKDEEKLLAAAYHSSLEEADKIGARHVAFSAISAGVYGYPRAKAAKVAMSAVKNYVEGKRQSKAIERITFVLFSSEMHDAFQTSLFTLFPDYEQE